jgi:hypothetical protein
MDNECALRRGKSGHCLGVRRQSAAATALSGGRAVSKKTRFQAREKQPGASLATAGQDDLLKYCQRPTSDGNMACVNFLHDQTLT